MDEVVAWQAPVSAVAALSSIHAALGGDAHILAAKSSGSAPTPDLIHRELGVLIEIDEVQHFTTSRLASFLHYPSDVDLGYIRADYERLILTWHSKGDAAFAHKVAPDFPARGGRQAQRAYNDALRDLLAPTFTGYPVIRIPVPDRSIHRAVTRLESVFADFASGRHSAHFTYRADEH